MLSSREQTLIEHLEKKTWCIVRQLPRNNNEFRVIFFTDKETEWRSVERLFNLKEHIIDVVEMISFTSQVILNFDEQTFQETR